MSILEGLWRRASVTTPVPDASALLVIAFAAFACVILAWPTVRMAVTVCHEAGHAVAATLTGRALQGIRLHSDTSGVTLTKGKPAGAGMVITLLAGYPAASLIGLLAAAVAGAGHAVAMLWLLVGLLALMLLKIRNVHGALIVLALGAVLALATWYAPAHILVWLAYGLAWLLLLAGPRPVLELALSPGPYQSRIRRGATLPADPPAPHGLDRPVAGRHAGGAGVGHRPDAAGHPAQHRLTRAHSPGPGAGPTHRVNKLGLVTVSIAGRRKRRPRSGRPTSSNTGCS